MELRLPISAITDEFAPDPAIAARAMAEAHPVPQAWTTWVQDDTIACRCEEVPAGRVRAAVAAGASDARQVKQLTRAGMGWCQGRM